ncbi:MAG: gluconeogenesis factor YvcK family protein [Chloroflexota bacterium]
MLIKQFETTKRWLRPGLGVKRWLTVLFIGITILARGFALLLRDLYQFTGYPTIIRILALQDLPRWLRASIFGGVGVGLILTSFYQINKTFVRALLPPETDAAKMADMLHTARRREKGPKIVTIGGGTGMSMLLSGLKPYTDNLTAIVTVADDGGSSGRLRRSLGILPPGDFRNCIAALADDESLMTQLFQYRFAKQGEENGLGGHSFGNLFITALVAVTGSFEQALVESGRVLAVRGLILPSTLKDVTLYADVSSEGGATQVRGESAIPNSDYPIERVYLEPDQPPAYPGAVKAILDADLIMLGPGSLYTSILPNLLVPEISQALRVCQAPKIYICNVATQKGETDTYSLNDHVRALENHIGPGLLTHVLANNNLAYPLPSSLGRDLVIPSLPSKIRYRLVEVDVIDESRPWRHDSVKLAKQLISWYQTEIQGRITEV